MRGGSVRSVAPVAGFTTPGLMVILFGMTSKVGPKGQVVIPKVMRDQLGIRPGDEVTFSLADGAVVVEPVRGRPPLRGRLRGFGMLEALEAEHAEEVSRGS